MLKDYPDNSKIFVFQANKFISDDGIKLINQKMSKFIEDWTVHGKNLKATFQVVAPLFIIVAVDETYAELSGCSKDALTNEIKTLGKDLDVDFFDRMMIAYHPNDEEIALIELSDFKSKLSKDEIRQNTIVYNNLIETKADLKHSWQIPVKDSWHTKLVSVI
jgi:hypothetical protein